MSFSSSSRRASPSSSSHHLPPLDTTTAPHRRYSQPPLPIPFPGLGLRAALLGYLGEVEASIRGRLGGSTGEVPSVDDSSASEGLSEDLAHEPDSDAEYPLAGDGIVGSSSRANGDHSELRYRANTLNTHFPDATAAARPDLAPRTQSYSSQDALLSHLSWLREDILASLPPAVFSAPSSSREWLRALPARLMAVERGLWADQPSGSASNGETTGSGTGSGAGYGIGGQVEDAVESARLKVLEMVRGVLPTDEWEGWERLGWEETDMRSFPSPRPATPLGATGEEEEEESESKFLFPNRTPAAKQAIASRRRTIRSKSLGAAGRPGTWAELQGRPGVGLGLEGMPRLQRMRTMPMLHRASALDDEEEEEDLGRKVDVEGVGGVLEDLPERLGMVEGDGDGDEVIIGKGKGKAGQKVNQALGPSIAEALVASDDGRRLMKYENLPIDWRNNEHIVTGYRFIPLHATTGPIPLLKSAFAWHNETINIHSHFIPSIFIMLVIPFMINSTPLPSAHPLDTAVLVLYFIAAISCLFTSAEWHVLSGCASKKWMEWGACVDYVGISWLIAASFGTVVYNAFYCQPKAVLLYCLTNAACGALGSYLPFQRWFNQRRMKPYRIAFFLFLNFAMFAPISQLFWKYGWTKGVAFCGPFVPSISTYFFGLLFYAFHFPECVWPGKFDRFAHSHQIWHAGIVIAIYLHYKAVFAIHDMRYDYSCAAPGAGRPVSLVVEGWWRSLKG